MKKSTTEETLLAMIDLLMQALEEIEDSIDEQTEFTYGEKRHTWSARNGLCICTQLSIIKGKKMHGLQ